MPYISKVFVGACINRLIRDNFVQRELSFFQRFSFIGRFFKKTVN